jgi:NTP pyrophosphatase (non-canonical NTP hydrolase)
MSIEQLIQEAHAVAKKSGFWDPPKEPGTLLMLVVSEAGEALEAHRKGRTADLQMYDLLMKLREDRGDPAAAPRTFEQCVKDTLADELADIVIRLADFCGGFGLSVGPVNYSPTVGLDKNGGPGMALFGLCAKLQAVGEAYIGYATGNGWDDSAITAAFTTTWSIANAYDIDLWRHIELKMAYNKTREPLHGKAY